MADVTYTEARASFATLWDRAVSEREPIRVTRRGKEDLALIAAAELDGLIETAHLLRSPRNAARLLAALNRALDGGGTPTTPEDLRREATGE